MRGTKSKVHLLLLNTRTRGQKAPKNNLNSSAPTYLAIFKNIGTLKKSGGYSSVRVGCNYHTNYHPHQIDCINQKAEFKKKSLRTVHSKNN